MRGLVPDSVFARTQLASYDGDLSNAPQVTGEATFVLRDSAEVAGERIMVTDVAECQGLASVCDEIYAVYLGETPLPGRSAVLSAEKFGQMVSAEWPELRFSVTGARFVRVEALLQEVGEEVVEAALQRLVSDKFYHETSEPGNFRVTLEKINARGKYRLRPGDFKISFPELDWEADESIADSGVSASVKRFFSSRQRRLRVEFVQKQSVTRDMITAEFNVQEYLPVAFRDILRGETVRAEDMRMTWVATDRESGSFVSSMQSVAGRRLRQQVVAGSPFETRHLEIPIAAKKGRMMRLLVKRGDMEIQSQVKILSNGGFGQIIEAQYPKTKKRVRVRVVDAETVQLAL